MAQDFRVQVDGVANSGDGVHRIGGDVTDIVGAVSGSMAAGAAGVQWHALGPATTQMYAAIEAAAGKVTEALRNHARAMALTAEGTDNLNQNSSRAVAAVDATMDGSGDLA